MRLAAWLLLAIVVLIDLVEAVSPPSSPHHQHAGASASADPLATLAEAANRQQQRDKDAAYRARFRDRYNTALSTPKEQRTAEQHSQLERVEAKKAMRRQSDRRRYHEKRFESAASHSISFGDDEKQDDITKFATGVRAFRAHVASGSSVGEAKAKADARITEFAQKKCQETAQYCERVRLRDASGSKEDRMSEKRKAAMATASKAAGIKQPAFMKKLKSSSPSSRQ